jgi:hypothetical protein
MFADLGEGPHATTESSILRLVRQLRRVRVRSAIGFCDETCECSRAERTFGPRCPLRKPGTSCRRSDGPDPTFRRLGRDLRRRARAGGCRAAGRVATARLFKHTRRLPCRLVGRNLIAMRSIASLTAAVVTMLILSCACVAAFLSMSLLLSDRERRGWSHGHPPVRSS